MISRIWHGYATHENADRYQGVVTGEVIPGILAMKIPGFRSIELFRKTRAEDVEFITIMWFQDLDAVKAFVGEDYERSHVPPRAREVLAQYDTRAQHYDILLAEKGRDSSVAQASIGDATESPSNIERVETCTEQLVR